MAFPSTTTARTTAARTSHTETNATPMRRRSYGRGLPENAATSRRR